jgi:glc operon protein GlcG
MVLSLAEAQKVMEGAIAKAKELKLRISVAVCDAGGRLVSLNTMDGAFLSAAYGSQGKAYAAAAFGRPSRQLAEIANGPLVRGIADAAGGHMIPSGGGLPILRDGVIVGTCGVGGGTDDQDDKCASAGIARLGSDR